MASPLDPETLRLLRCPACGGELDSAPSGHECRACRVAYPVAGGVPILIDDAASILRREDYASGSDRVLYDPSGGGGDSRLRRMARAVYASIPELASNVATHANYVRLTRLLAERESRRVLIVGGREVGRGMDVLLASPGVETVETDIDLGPRTQLVCDAHQLPFADGSFDAVVAQAVLEHVLDPGRCVSEMHRVLRRDGLVYAETPFLYRRHGGEFDFTRYTFLGHRRLLRGFEEIASGAALGPGSALALSYTGFLLCLSRNRAVRGGLRVLGALTSFWLKYLDPFLVRNDTSLDSAAGFYFLGRRSESPLSDRDLIRGFRGMR